MHICSVYVFLLLAISRTSCLFYSITIPRHLLVLIDWYAHNPPDPYAPNTTWTHDSDPRLHMHDPLCGRWVALIASESTPFGHSSIPPFRDKRKLPRNWCSQCPGSSRVCQRWRLSIEYMQLVYRIDKTNQSYMKTAVRADSTYADRLLRDGFDRQNHLRCWYFNHQ